MHIPTPDHQLLLQIVESSLEELRDLRLLDDQAPIGSWYSSVLMAYYLGKSDDLSELLRQIPLEVSQQYPSLQTIATARLDICLGTFTPYKTLQLQDAIAKEASPLVKAEGFFVLSTITSYLEDHAFSRLASRQAAKFYRLAGANKKSLRATMNALAEESCIEPSKSYMADYLYLAKRALEIEDIQTGAICFYNISCELKKAGAFHPALNYVQRSLALLNNEIAGRLFYKAIAHRCDIQIDLGRKADAQTDFEILLLSPFPESRNEADTLRTLHPWLVRKSHSPLHLKSDSEHPRGIQTPNWRERVGLSPQAPFGKLEEKLIQLLLEGKQDRTFLIKMLYGDRIDFQYAENRFKSLLNRLRKRMPGLVVVQDGCYELQIDSDTIRDEKLGII